MNRGIAAGAVAGLIAGLGFDAVMRVMPGAGAPRSMIAFVADVVHAPSHLDGWLVYPVYGVVIGMFFGWWLRDRRLDDLRAALWGGLYGIAWWIIAGLILIPGALGLWPLSALAVDRLRPVALPLLVGHLLYGVVLGLAAGRITGMMSRQARSGPAHHAGRRAA